MLFIIIGGKTNACSMLYWVYVVSVGLCMCAWRCSQGSLPQVCLPLIVLFKWNYCPCGFHTNLEKHLLRFVLPPAAVEDQLLWTLLWSGLINRHTQTSKERESVLHLSWRANKPAKGNHTISKQVGKLLNANKKRTQWFVNHSNPKCNRNH